MPQVSVCIPVYGVEKYIERCARSLFEQTLDAMEYVFVDDCSPDKSIEVMQLVLAEYPHRREQVKVIRHEKNMGVGAARNHAVAACTGDYIIHCDPDDWVDLDLYEKMYAKAVETDADMVYCSCSLHFEKTDKIINSFAACDFRDKAEMLETFVKYGFLFIKLFRKAIALDKALNCPDDICMCEDLLRGTQMILKCKKTAPVSKVSYHYFIHSKSSVHLMNFAKIENCIYVENFLYSIIPYEYKKVLLYTSFWIQIDLLTSGHYSLFLKRRDHIKIQDLFSRVKVSPVKKLLYLLGLCSPATARKIYLFLMLIKQRFS